MANFCTVCKTQNDDGARFCARCGAQMPPQQQPFTQQLYAQQQTAQPFSQQPYAQQPYAQPPQPYAQPQQPYAQPPQQPYAQAPGQQPYPQPAQPMQPQGAAFVDMHIVLMQAPGALNIPGRPWAVAIEGASIVARWKWMDATFFSPHEVTDETRQYTFTVTLSENGKWKEVDVTQNKSSGVKMSGGKIGFGSSSSSFKGKTSQKSFSLGVGQNNQTGQAGIIGFKFDTTSVKQPIRDYLAAQGWKKAGMFG